MDVFYYQSYKSSFSVASAKNLRNQIVLNGFHERGNSLEYPFDLLFSVLHDILTFGEKTQANTLSTYTAAVFISISYF